MGNYNTYRQLNTKDGSSMHQEADKNGNFQTLDSLGGGAFDFKNLHNHNEQGSLMLPGINDHRNSTTNLGNFGETLEPKGHNKNKKK